MKKYLSLIIFAILGITLTGCGNKSTNSTNDQNTDEKQEGTRWLYQEEKDDLTGNVISLHATLFSNDYKEIDHNNNTGRMAILLTYKPDIWGKKLETTVMFGFTEDNGQCRLADSGSSGILAVFDDGDVDETWSLIYMSKDKKALYINSSYSGPEKVKAFINKLKASKQCKIQVRLNEVGNTTFTFNTAGLKWDFDN